MVEYHDVLNPWGEADPVEVRGLAPRVTSWEGRTIGLFMNWKPVAPVLQDCMERLIGRHLPSVRITKYVYPHNDAIYDREEGRPFEEWVRTVDAVIGAMGD